MNVLHLLASGGTGGIEVLCKEIAKNSSHNNYFCFMWSGGDIYDEMKNLGYNVILLKENRHAFITPYIKINKLCKINNIDIVIVHHEAPVLWLYLSVLKLFNTNLKTIIYAHENMENMVRLNISQGLIVRKIVFYSAVRRSDKVIAISNSVKSSITDNIKLSKDKIRVIYNGIDTKYLIRTTERERSNKVKIVYIGRLVSIKGVDILIKALPEICKKYDIECNIIGDGNIKDELQNLTDSLNLNKQVHFRGNQRNIKDWLEDSDIFVHPAICKEGFGISVVEAMSMKLICVASDNGGIPEIIQDGVNGFLLHDIYPKKLMHKLSFLIEKLDDSSLKNLRKNARATAEKFDINRYILNFDNIIENL